MLIPPTRASISQILSRTEFLTKIPPTRLNIDMPNTRATTDWGTFIVSDEAPLRVFRKTQPKTTPKKDTTNSPAPKNIQPRIDIVNLQLIHYYFTKLLYESV
jgi:hypothetical protein